MTKSGDLKDKDFVMDSKENFKKFSNDIYIKAYKEGREDGIRLVSKTIKDLLKSMEDIKI